MMFVYSYEVRYEVKERGGKRKREREIAVRINTKRAGERKLRGHGKRYFFFGGRKNVTF
jgi:hypothetical protein